ncbi:MAG: hypothetical protein R3F11_08595 [Verrucomicrobiales bacterium]
MSAAESPPYRPPLLPQIAALFRAARLGLKARALGSLRTSKLMVGTLAGFLVGYLVVGYFLFYKGLSYIARLPGVGGLLTERILFLSFFFFFVMLVFSNAVIGYSALFRNRETRWLLTLPIDHRALFVWRFVECLGVSSWGLIFLSAPLLAAIGQILDAPLSFYIKGFFAYLPFVAIPAALAAWVLVLIVSFVGKRPLQIIGVTLLALTLYYAYRAFTFGGEMRQTEDIAVTLNAVLRNTEVSVNPFVPSTWLTSALLSWARGAEARGLFDSGLLLSYAMMGGLVTAAAASRLFYPAWNASLMRRAANAKSRRKVPPAWRGGLGEAFARLIPASRPIRALLITDARLFWREPAQWAQFLVIFGLLFVYVLNIRNMGYDYQNPLWSAIISYLNLGVCALALSTLTTRFVFPQLSLEGRRLWILGLAPFSLARVLWAKFCLSFFASSAITGGLVLSSGIMLGLPVGRVAFFLGSIVSMSAGLTGLAIGLGALFPNLRESNPAKIVSGFGGTLCLILSFLYIVLVMTCLVYPTAVRLAEKLDQAPGGALAVGIGGAAGATVVALVPLALALYRVRRPDYLALA